MLVTPQFIQTDEQLTAVIHLTVPRAEISNVMGSAITEIMSSIAAQGATSPDRAFLTTRKDQPTFLISRWVSPLVSQSLLPAALR